MRIGLVGLAKYSMLVLAFAAIVSFAVLNLGAVFAIHDVVVTVSPNLTGSNSSQLITFNVTVDNINGSTYDNISEFRIEYELLNFSQFNNTICLPKAGWSLSIIHMTDDGNACLYIALNSSDTIKGGKNSTFQFTAYPPSTECCRVLNFEVRGVNFDWEPKEADICVDPIPPLTTKTYGDPHFPEDINSDAPYPHYISTLTPITLTANDNVGVHDTGIDKTWWYDQIVPDEYCQSQQACESWNECPTPYDPCACGNGNPNGMECVNNAQKICKNIPAVCDQFGQILGYSNYNECIDALPTWADCVEKVVNSVPPSIDFPDRIGCVSCTCKQNWQLYRGVPFNKPEESCHIIQFFSVDGVGNIEPLKKQCVFVDNTPPIGIKEVADPKIVMPDDLEHLGDGQAEWTTDNANTGSYSAKLTIPDGATGTDFAGVDSQLTNFVGLDTISSLSYYRKVTQADQNPDKTYGWTPIVILGVDANGDGKFDAKPLEWEASLSAGAVNASLLGGDSFIQCEATTGLTGTDANFVKVDGYTNFACYTPNVAGTDYNMVYKPLSYFQSNDVERIQTTDKIAMVKVELGGNPSTQDNEIAYVDTVELNGKVVIDEPTSWWVGMNTDVTLSCTDQEPHPVNHNEVCYKVSFDDPPGSFLTEQYCNKFGGEMEGDWCCAPSQPQQADGDLVAVDQISGYTLYFTEDSLHNLEYYCRDALGNAGQTDLEYFKVDAKSPVITKIIDGPSSGQCPPQKEGDICYIDGVTKIHVDATDPEPHPVDNVKCEWYYILDDNQKIFGGDDTSPPFDINFKEETKHELHIKCWDALKNKVEDVETFYVDKTPPVTTKTYGDPFFVNSADWITSNTPITLTVDDAGPHKSGIKETKYRVTLMENDEPCLSDGVCQRQTGTGDFQAYTAPFTIGQESCHLIEYYSVDNVNKTETLKRQCVFVDNTPPKTTKEIGEPKVVKGEEEDTYITQDTEITLTCSDQEPHPVDHSMIWYRYRVSNDCESWGQWTAWIDSEVSGDPTEKTITFPEDSCHQLEYYCVDALGNKEPTQSEIDIVDTEPPVITKTIIGPYSGACPPTPIPIGEVKLAMVADGEGPKCFIDGVTKIHVEATDPQPHPVDTVTCDWDYVVYGGDKTGEGQTGVTPPFDINFPEESEHVLMITCRDALGNAVSEEEIFFVDKTPPVTTKTYGDPFFANSADWITSNTPITLTVDDAGPHKSGIKETKYRVTLMENDEPCLSDGVCQQQTGGDEDYTTYDGAFTIGQESCHLIEYYSVDNVNKTEVTKKQCVFVDNKAPVPNKTVGDPKTMWDGKDAVFYDLAGKCWGTGEDAIDCWKVTMCTPITLECIDPQPHPVDHNKVCFKVGIDGDDATSKYCGEHEGVIGEDGFCCLSGTKKDFIFKEETEHNLAYYCVDALGNKGPIDDEKFKVGGTNFTIPLYKKWNLISVPFVLLNDNPSEVFQDTPGVNSVWAYDGATGDWLVYTPGDGPDTLTSIEPGWGYWVLENQTKENLLIGGSLFNTRAVPPSRDLVKGWNLIGYYGTNMKLVGNGNTQEGNSCGGTKKLGEDVYCALNSLIDTQEGYPRWSSLWTFTNKGNHNTYWTGLETCDPNHYTDQMFAGKGYWIEIDKEDLYAPASTCVWNSDFRCAGGHYPS